MSESPSDAPLVSVIVPSLNQGRFIKETLESILAQDHRPLEVLVMDGGSTDETISVLGGYRGTPEIQWVSERDTGVVEAVNKGLSRARGQFLAIQSSDDVYLPGAISSAVELLAGQRDVGLVYGDVEYIDERSVVTGRERLERFDLRRYLGRFTYIPQPCAVFRAEAARGAGGWRKEVSYTADADFWLRIATRWKVTKIDRVMAQYRYHANQRDRQRSRIAADWHRMISDFLAANNVDGRTRQFARMGIHLANHRYTAERDWLARSIHLYRAALVNPRAVWSPKFPKRELIPGREPVWKFMSRVKRSLGFQPRVR